MAFKTFPLRLLESRHVTPSILHLVFTRDDAVEIEYQAGQFINIHFDNDGKKIHRSYSIANAPGADYMEIAMSPVAGGRATTLLSGLSVGDVIEGSGPYGRFVLRDEEPTRSSDFGFGHRSQEQPGSSHCTPKDTGRQECDRCLPVAVDRVAMHLGRAC